MLRLVTLAFLFLPGAALACGAETDCPVGDRIYRIHIGEDVDPGKGAIVFAHGYRGSARGVMRNRALKRLADDLGVALIALDAKEDDWKLDNAPREIVGGQEGEMAYTENVLEDAEARFGLGRDRLVATGFSAGGMMTWTLACHRSDLFAGFAPLSGTFWDPVPESCPSPAKSLIHIHGDDDPTVPIMGRPIAQTRQGELPAALEMYQSHGDFGSAETYSAGDMQCERRENAIGATLDYCLFEGGHSFSVARLRHAWEVLTD